MNAPEKESSFERLAKINVKDKIEKKNGLSYLSWAWAWDQLLRNDPDADFEYLAPTAHAGDTLMVYCTVTAFGKKRTAHLPVMDHRNKAIAQPDAFQINTAMQRCLVKAIGLHGLGLYIYAGEDVPTGTEPEPIRKEVSPLPAMKQEAFDALPVDRKESIRRTAADLEALLSESGRQGDAAKIAEALSMEEQLALSSIMSAKDCAALKGAIRELRRSQAAPKAA